MGGWIAQRTLMRPPQGSALVILAIQTIKRSETSHQRVANICWTITVNPSACSVVRCLPDWARISCSKADRMFFDATESCRLIAEPAASTFATKLVRVPWLMGRLLMIAFRISMDSLGPISGISVIELPSADRPVIRPVESLMVTLIGLPENHSIVVGGLCGFKSTPTGSSAKSSLRIFCSNSCVVVLFGKSACLTPFRLNSDPFTAIALPSGTVPSPFPILALHFRGV